MHEQALLSLSSDTLYVAQDRMYLRLAAQIAVESYAEAVSLVPYPLEQFQSLGISVYE